MRDIDPDSWSQIIDLAIEHNLAPFLAVLLNQNRYQFSENLYETLMIAYRQAASRFLILQNAQLTITRALNSADIPHMWLKGIVLAATVYPDGALRPMGDLDLLVTDKYIQQALNALHNNGYNFDDTIETLSPPIIDGHERSDHYVLHGGPGHTVIVELHFWLLSQRNWDLFPPHQQQWFQQQAQSYQVGSVEMMAPSAEAHLLYLCAHLALQHGLSDFVMTRFLDIHYLIETNTLNWQLIIEKANELDWTYAIEQCLRSTHELFSTLIPPEVLLKLRDQRPSEATIQRVEVLAKPGFEVEKIRLTMQRLTWRQRLQWARQIIAPNRHYMRWHYHLSAEQAVWPAYIQRWRHQIHQIIIWIRS